MLNKHRESAPPPQTPVRTRLYLAVASKELSGAELERRVGLPADRTRDVGTVDARGARMGTSAAEYDSGLEPTAPVGDHIAAFMRRLGPVRDRIGSIYANPGSIYGRLNLYCTTQDPFWEYKFQPEELAFFAALGLELIVTVNRATPPDKASAELEQRDQTHLR
jgi:hypothetical protein